ncbi:MAG: HAD family hydrolase [Syntrophus sp. (in: bacteria)]|nr:HAD family hydrolase [Syntrophus sp. (in: bacteria)]
MKKIISFDLDGTLVNARYGDMVWNHGIPLEYSKKYNMSFDEAKGLIRKQYESVGDADLLWYEIDRWLDKFQLSVTSEELLERYESQIEPVPYAQEVLEYLGQKYMLVIASNAARIFVDKELDYTNFRRYFTRIISATSDCKMVKKEDRFYQWLCGELQVSPDEIIHIGDHPVFDHDIPSRVGIESYCLMSEQPHADDSLDLDGRRTITSLKELLDRL